MILQQNSPSVMNQKLLERVVTLTAKDPALYQHRSGDDFAVNRFHGMFPMGSLSSMSLEQYCLGHGCKQESFSWWLERGLQKSLGSYSPGTSRGHLIYRQKDGNYFIHRYFREFGPEKAIEIVRKTIYAIASCSTLEEARIVDDQDTLAKRAGLDKKHVVSGQARILRILTMYHPEWMLPINSIDHLKHFLTELSVGEDFKLPDKSIDLVIGLSARLDEIRTATGLDITPWGFSKLLYDHDFGIVPKKRDSIYKDENAGEDGGTTKIGGGTKAVPWWQRFFMSEEQAHLAFDLFREACDALGVDDSSGTAAQRVSFTNIREGKREKLRLICGQTQVLEVTMASEGEPNAAFVMRVDDPSEGFVPGYQFKTPYAGHMLGLFRIDLADLLEQGSSAREPFFAALGDVSATYTGIKRRTYPEAHRPMLLNAAFRKEDRSGLFANGPKGGPSMVQPDPTPSLGYAREDALKDLFMDGEALDRAIALLRRKKNIILQGAPGTGKTFVARRLAYLLIGDKDPSRAPMVQFHQSTAYEDFIQGYRPDGNGGFEMKNGIFHDFCRRAAEDEEGRPFVFIIDEINRGNLSKILGEIMMLIESDKRGPSFAVPLAYASSQDETFHIPENVFLIGTMNTADRSLSLVDYALRRRFAFVEMEPGFSSPAFEALLLSRGANPNLLAAIRTRMGQINDLIGNDTHDLGQGYRIGHSFFVPAEGVPVDHAWYFEVIRHEILPLLEEYWVDDEKSRKSAHALLLAEIH